MAPSEIPVTDHAEWKQWKSSTEWLYLTLHVYSKLQTEITWGRREIEQLANVQCRRPALYFLLLTITLENTSEGSIYLMFVLAGVSHLLSSFLLSNELHFMLIKIFCVLTNLILRFGIVWRFAFCWKVKSLIWIELLEVENLYFTKINFVDSGSAPLLSSVMVGLGRISAG